MNTKLKTWLVAMPLFSILHIGCFMFFPNGLLWELILTPVQGWLLGVILMTFITILHKEPTT